MFFRLGVRNRRATLPLLRRRYEGLSPSGQSVKGVRNDNIEYRCGRFSLSFRGKAVSLDVGISLQLLNRDCHVATLTLLR